MHPLQGGLQCLKHTAVLCRGLAISINLLGFAGHTHGLAWVLVPDNDVDHRNLKCWGVVLFSNSPSAFPGCCSPCLSDGSELCRIYCVFTNPRVLGEGSHLLIP